MEKQTLRKQRHNVGNLLSLSIKYTIRRSSSTAAAFHIILIVVLRLFEAMHYDGWRPQCVKSHHRLQP